jgi:hypothetical protein
MARPQKPTNLLHLNGAFDKNPQRLDERPVQTAASSNIGPSPKHWRLPEADPGFEKGLALIKIWREVVRVAPWLVPSQRMTLEDVCELRYMARNGGLKPSERNQLRLLSNSLGLDGVGKKGPSAPATEVPSDPRDAFERLRG